MVDLAVVRGPVDGPDKPELVIEGGRARIGLAALRDLADYREVLSAFVQRQVKVRYKQAAIGIGWALLQPVVAALIFALFLGRFARVSSEGVPYVVFALAGTVGWNFFSSSVSSAMESVVTDQTLLRKVYFPREIFPLSSVLAALVDLLPALATLVAVALAYGLRPHLAWLALPAPLLLLVLAALAAGLALSALNVYYRDVRYVLPFVLQLGLFATPVVYSLAVVPHRFRLAYAVLNPVAAAIDALRRIVLHGTWPAPLQTLVALGWTAALAVAGFALFKRLERGFADRI